MDETRKSGRVTIPTDLDVVPETLEILKKWGADAIRDCDGTDFPQQLKDADAKIYSTYYTTRKDNAWAKANPDEVQQCYIMTGFYTAPGDTVTIPLMKGISPELMQVNTNDDITRWWEVMDRTTGQPVPPEQWSYADGSVTVQAVPFHEYTVSFLAYLIWDPVHMYNATTNGWTNFEHQITFDVRQPKTHKYSMERLRKFIAEHPYVNVIRYTTFFHQFTLIFDELKREKFVDWYGYSASVSPYILNQFEQEVGYKFRPEYIIDQGYYNNQYRVPSKEFRDFQAFQRREVAKLAKEMVDITHACGCEAMMFLGDHWIGTEPFMPEFKSIGLDAVVGSVGNGSTLRRAALPAHVPGHEKANHNGQQRAQNAQRHRGSVDALCLLGHGNLIRNACTHTRYQQTVRVHAVGRAGHERHAVLAGGHAQLGIVVGLDHVYAVDLVAQFFAHHLDVERVAHLQLIQAREQERAWHAAVAGKHGVRARAAHGQRCSI